MPLTDLLLFKTLSEEAPVALLAINCQTGHFIYANKLAKSLFEIGESNIKTCNYYQLIPKSENSNFLNLNKDMISREGYYQNLMISKFNGVKFVGNVSVKKIHIQDQDVTLFMCHDVTLQLKLQRDLTAKQVEIEKAFQELLVQNAQLKELDLAKTRFIALTTHELRTPLSAMIGSAELLKEKLYDTDEERDDFINMIHEQGLHLSELVNDILDYAKITSGKMDYYIQQQDLIPILNMLTEQFQPMADQDQIQLRLVFDKNYNYNCYFDELRIKQVISNILSNAIKYNKTNGKVEVSIKDEDKNLVVYIQDTGKGIAQEQLDQVFNEFETLGKVANHQKGTGLGMPISKRLIEGMGGKIHLTSELGVGSTFWITIPKEKVLDESLYRTRSDTFDLAAS